MIYQVEVTTETRHGTLVTAIPAYVLYYFFFFLSLFLKVLFFVFFWFLFSFVSFNPFLIYIIFLSPKHQHSSWEKIGFEREKRFSWYWITITYYICMITLYNVGRVAQSV